MTPEELLVFSNSISARHTAAISTLGEISPAPDNAPSTEHQVDAYVEAIFLRAFTAYENDMEKLFLHYVTGGRTATGIPAQSYLSITDETHARKLTKAGFKFLSWAKPTEIRNTAEHYLHQGWPIYDMMNAKSQDLSDCERIRNRIAHNSAEASSGFKIVQRNHLGTERIFDITPGQFLRIRSVRLRKLIVTHYLEVMNDTVNAVISPPP